MLDIELISKLLADYLDEIIMTQDFCDRYNRIFFKIEAGEGDSKLFNILEDLFEDIDSYSPMWTPEDEAKYPYRITEPTLRLEAKKSLLDLREYLLTRPYNQKDEPN